MNLTPTNTIRRFQTNLFMFTKLYSYVHYNVIVVVKSPNVATV